MKQECESMIKEQYVSFEVAKLLKEKGFDEGCSFVVNAISKGVMPVSWPTTNSDIEDEKASLIALPTLQMACKWLREVHNIHISITFGWVSGYNAQVDWAEESEKGNDKPACCVWRTYLNTTYEAAVEAAIKYCLEEIVR